MTLRELCEKIERGEELGEYELLVNTALRSVIERAFTELLERVQLLIMALENPALAPLVPPLPEGGFGLYETLAGLLILRGVSVREVEEMEAKIALVLLYHELDKQTARDPQSWEEQAKNMAR